MHSARVYERGMIGANMSAETYNLYIVSDSTRTFPASGAVHHDQSIKIEHLRPR
jgi:hypothetical protein